MPKEELTARFPRLAELPFDSDRKRMTSVNQIEGKNVVIVKGAFDSIAPRCTSGDLEAAARINDQMSQNALRVLAIAYRASTPSRRSPRSRSWRAASPSWGWWA